MDRCYPRGWPTPALSDARSGQTELGAAGWPRRVATGRPESLRDDDLLLPRGLVGILGELAAAVPEPCPVAELEAAVVAVAGVDRPVAARLAAREVIPHAGPGIGDDPAGGRRRWCGHGRDQGR